MNEDVEKAAFWQKYYRVLSEREQAGGDVGAARAMVRTELAALLEKIDADPATTDADRLRLGLPPRGMRELVGEPQD